MSEVFIADSTYTGMQETMEKVFDFLSLDLEGKTVLLKPNLLWPSEPEQGLNTHPAVIEAAVRCCEERKASRVYIGDNAGQIMYGNSKGAFYGSGLGEKLGKYYVNLGIDLEKFHLDAIDKDVYISRLIQKVDVIINLPKFKTHKLTGITGAVKNTFGYLPGGQKARMHVIAHSHDRFGETLAQIHMIRNPDASITDAVLGMQGNGASGPDLRYIGKILASRDPVSLDMVQAEMMGYDPREIKHLVAAEKMGLGELSYTANQEVKVLEGFKKAPGFEDPKLMRESVTSPGLDADAAKMIPTVDTEKCIRCGSCVKQCPAGVLELKDIPVQIKEDCAGCHACQEVCPTGAMFLGEKQ